MPFTYDATTNRGKVRLLLGDTDTTDATKQIFDDAEIDAFLALEDNDIRRAVAAGCESLAASSARSAVRYKAEKLFEIDRKDIPAYFSKLAAMHRKNSVDLPFEELDSFDYTVGGLGTQMGEFVGDTLFD